MAILNFKFHLVRIVIWIRLSFDEIERKISAWLSDSMKLEEIRVPIFAIF